MLGKSGLQILLCGTFIYLCSMNAYGHGGGLNSSGCHNDRKRGDYHCHRSSYTPDTSNYKSYSKPSRPSSSTQSLFSSRKPSSSISTALTKERDELKSEVGRLKAQQLKLLTLVSLLEKRNAQKGSDSDNQETSSKAYKDLESKYNLAVSRLTTLEAENIKLKKALNTPTVQVSSDTELLKSQNASLLDRMNKLEGKLNSSIKAKLPSSASTKQPSIKLVGLHRLAIRKKKGPPSSTRTVNGLTVWTYKDVEFMFSGDHKVLQVAKSHSLRNNAPARKQPVSTVAQAIPEYKTETTLQDRNIVDWDCDKGYEKSTKGCKKIVVPTNAQLDYFGSAWECMKGFQQQGNRCIKIRIPPNAKLNYFGKAWECNPGYKRHGNGCGRIQIPPNARLNYGGKSWVCNHGYKRLGNGCGRIQTPRNARLNHSGSNWMCNSGYLRRGNGCIKKK